MDVSVERVYERSDLTVVGTGSDVSGPGERGQGILMLAPVRLARFVKRERERERERESPPTSGPSVEP